MMVLLRLGWHTSPPLLLGFSSYSDGKKSMELSVKISAAAAMETGDQVTREQETDSQWDREVVPKE